MSQSKYVNVIRTSKQDYNPFSFKKSTHPPCTVIVGPLSQNVYDDFETQINDITLSSRKENIQKPSLFYPIIFEKGFNYNSSCSANEFDVLGQYVSTVGTTKTNFPIVTYLTSSTTLASSLLFLMGNIRIMAPNTLFYVYGRNYFDSKELWDDYMWFWSVIEKIHNVCSGTYQQIIEDIDEMYFVVTYDVAAKYNWVHHCGLLQCDVQLRAHYSLNVNTEESTITYQNPLRLRYSSNSLQNVTTKVEKKFMYQGDSQVFRPKPKRLFPKVPKDIFNSFPKLQRKRRKVRINNDPSSQKSKIKK